eukprot:CAMPEP_0119053874 /NCGR_PEP_ID=MMETSP1177-20130426/74705_1 /TAXON_ID=2985 /ORGANISM="Ochromonas sp, Strain CCMP1899" /LENGTH=285 /DNA_ID=CAMNT_0007033943 /DNA_START=381 /DNA_END=1238 /DNA_ORIENTATION=-
MFCFRLMINRVSKYWLPEIVQKHISKGYALYKTIWPTTVTTTNGNSRNSNSLNFDQSGDAPIYQQKSVQLGDTNELILAIEDPSRLKILRNLAVKNHLVENVDFICGVLKFKEEAETLIMDSSSVASDEMKTQAMAMWYQYLQINSPDEVNVSSTAREMLKSQLDQWAPNAKVISKLVARKCLETDGDHRTAIFEVAFREILTMLYQNLWTKFRVEEAQALTLEDEDNDGVMFVFKKEKRQKSVDCKDRKVVQDRKDSEKESRSTVLQPISEINSGKDDGSYTPL